MFKRFVPGDTNLALQEFEKCGPVLKHVPGPGDANWIHILYQQISEFLFSFYAAQNQYDAQRAVGKNGSQINSVLMIGVKPTDAVHRQYMNESLNSSNHSFMIPSFMSCAGYRRTSSDTSNAPGAAARPSILQNGGVTTTASTDDPAFYRMVVSPPPLLPTTRVKVSQNHCFSGKVSGIQSDGLMFGI